MWKQEPIKQEPIKQEPIKQEPIKQQDPVKQDPAKNGFVVSITADPLVCDVNQQITIEWEVTSGKSTSSDWIGMYAVTDPPLPNKKYITSQYRGVNEKKGVVTFYATIFGKYEFRYLRGYDHFGKTQIVEVGPRFDITAKIVEGNAETKTPTKIVGEYQQKSGNEYKSAWIGLYAKGAASGSYVTYEKVKTPSGQVTFNLPTQKGEYELRFFPQKYDCVATSNSVTV